MIDGLFKKHIDPLWERAATPLVRLGLTPNAVTLIGLVLVAASCALYLWHRSAPVFGAMLALSFTSDALDGAVARQRKMMSKAGGYLDAMVDRYQELLVIGAIAYVSDSFALGLLAFSGAVLTSYAKARTALEQPICNDDWPDLFERLERIVFLCGLLLVEGLVTWLDRPRPLLLPVGLAAYAVLAHLTAAQRMRRAFKLLRRSEE